MWLSFSLLTLVPNPKKLDQMTIFLRFKSLPIPMDKFRSNPLIKNANCARGVAEFPGVSRIPGYAGPVVHIRGHLKQSIFWLSIRSVSKNRTRRGGVSLFGFGSRPKALAFSSYHRRFTEYSSTSRITFYFVSQSFRKMVTKMIYFWFWLTKHANMYLTHSQCSYVHAPELLVSDPLLGSKDSCL